MEFGELKLKGKKYSKNNKKTCQFKNASFLLFLTKLCYNYIVLNKKL